MTTTNTHRPWHDQPRRKYPAQLRVLFIHRHQSLLPVPRRLRLVESMRWTHGWFGKILRHMIHHHQWYTLLHRPGMYLRQIDWDLDWLHELSLISRELLGTFDFLLSSTVNRWRKPSTRGLSFYSCVTCRSAQNCCAIFEV